MLAFASPALAEPCADCDPGGGGGGGGTNAAPTVTLSADAGGAARGIVVHYSASASDPNGDHLTYSWQVDGNAAFGSGSTFNTSFATLGMHSVTVTVSDGSKTASDTKTISVFNVGPSASFDVSSSSPLTGETITLTSTSSDFDNDALTCSWDLNDDSVYGDKTGCSITTSYLVPGPHTVRLKVDDGHTATSTASATVTAQNQLPIASFTATPSSAQVGTPVAFDASATSDPEGADIDLYEWDFDGNGSYDADGANPAVSHTYAAAGTYTVKLRVTDADGGSATTTRTVTVTNPPAEDSGDSGSDSGSGGGGNAGGGSQQAAAGGSVGSGSAVGGTGSGQHLAGKAVLKSRFKSSHNKTMVTKLALSHLPDGAIVKLSCKGKGCGFKSKSFRAHGGTLDLTRAFKGRKLAKGARITITVSTPGGDAQRFTIKARGAKKPLQTAS